MGKRSRRKRELRALKVASPYFDWPEVPVFVNPEPPGDCSVCKQPISPSETWATLTGQDDGLLFQAHLDCAETLSAVHGNISNLRPKPNHREG